MLPLLANVLIMLSRIAPTAACLSEPNLDNNAALCCSAVFLSISCLKVSSTPGEISPTAARMVSVATLAMESASLLLSMNASAVKHSVNGLHDP